MILFAYHMMETILVIQILTWLITLAALAGMAMLVAQERFSWLLLLLPILFFLNLYLFLTERLIVKFNLLTLPDIFYMPQFINNWAVGIQFHAALTAAVAIGVVLLNGRLTRRQYG